MKPKKGFVKKVPKEVLIIMGTVNIVGTVGGIIFHATNQGLQAEKAGDTVVTSTRIETGSKKLNLGTELLSRDQDSKNGLKDKKQEISNTCPLDKQLKEANP